MSKKDLQKDIRSNGGYILSDGTLNLQHLLPKAYDLLNRYGIQAKDLKEEIFNCFQVLETKWKVKEQSLFTMQYYSEAELKQDEESLQTASYLWNDDIYMFFNSLAPNGYYFGSSEGDGSCIGWFKYEEEEF
jgi:hypothetical protein